MYNDTPSMESKSMEKNIFKTKTLPLTYIRLTFLLLFLSTSCLATNYYMSAAGNDSNTGTSPRQAWRTLERLNNLVPKPGDSILFQRGDAWTGTVSVNMWGMEGRPLVYGAYGEGPKPRIYGSEPVKGWEKHSGSIYKATFDKEINQLFVDGKKMRAARFPNSGYIFITSTNGSTTFSADELDENINYSGAKWFGRTHYYAAPLINIAGSRSKTLMFSSAPRHPLKEGLGFFLMNKLEFLDQAGEWYYDKATKTVYFWFPDGYNPDEATVRGSVYKDGLHVNGKNHVTIRDLNFLQQAEKGIHLNDADYIVIDNNDLSDADGFGIYCQSDATGYTIVNNTVEGVNHYGMYLRISNSLISKNRISKVALFENLGLTGTGEDNFGGGIYLAGEDGNNRVQYNEITEIGYNGILFAKPKKFIEYNYIKDVCLLKSDMGAIYTSWYHKRAPQGPEGSIVRNNIILNVVGEKYGYTSKRHMGEGIYIDESSVGVIVENNTIAHCTNSGIKLHKTEN
ncbi:MAG: right-handed parallel beta-helix repeat-containing protein, partial [Bacteroidota bacterium]